MDSCRRHSPLREMMTTAANRNIRPLNSILNLHCFMRCHTSSLLIVLLSQLWHNSGSPLRRPATAWARCPSQSRPASSLPHLRARTPSHQTITWRRAAALHWIVAPIATWMAGWLARLPARLLAPQASSIFSLWRDQFPFSCHACVLCTILPSSTFLKSRVGHSIAQNDLNSFRHFKQWSAYGCMKIVFC